MLGVMPDITREEIERRMDKLAREYRRTAPEDRGAQRFSRNYLGCASVLTGC
jgi:hypothetical protein